MKSTKTRRQRSFYVDADTMAMLGRHCQERVELVELAEIPLGSDPFLFSLAPRLLRAHSAGLSLPGGSAS